MYKEELNSISLMRLNVYYRDRRFGNKNMMALFNAKERVKKASKLFKDVCNVRKQGTAKTWLQIKACFNPRLTVDHTLTYDFDHTYELSYKATGKEIKGRIAVYTSIFGNYDPLIQPLYKSSNCDYFAITDQDIPEDGVWKKIDTSKIPGFDEMDNYHKSKYCKMFPHILFPEHEYSIWVDGNVQIVADLVPLVDRLKEDKVMGTFRNPLHDCIYTEANYNICQGYANQSQLVNQIDEYRKEGFPKQFGMREFSIIVRRHGDKRCIELMESWWKQVNTYTMRDQISFPYVLWKNGYTIDVIQLLGENWRWNPRFMWYPHNWHINFIGNRSNES